MKISDKKGLFKQSETRLVFRSQINFAAYNPKRHSPEQIAAIKKNFKNVAYLGGIIVNERTWNLIDGHKRLMAMDSIYRYDGTKENDYQVKVEIIDIDEKTEKEQNIFQTKSRTDLDNELIASLLPEIDYKLAGLNEEDIKMIEVVVPDFDFGSIDLGSDIVETSKKKVKEISAEEKKNSIKEAKSGIKNSSEAAPYVTITFDSFENKAYFMERFGFDQYQEFIKGERFENIIERVE